MYLLAQLQLNEGSACDSVDVASGHESVEEDGWVSANNGGHLAQESLEDQIALSRRLCTMRLIRCDSSDHPLSLVYETRIYDILNSRLAQARCLKNIKKALMKPLDDSHGSFSGPIEPWL